MGNHETVSIHDMSAWLAEYAMPPMYARTGAGVPITATSVSDRAKAWAYAITTMIDEGLMSEGPHDHERPD